MFYRAAAVSLAVLFFLPSQAFALPFGGSYASTPCGGGRLLTVGAPIGGIYLWVPSSPPYLYNPPTAGWVLGNALSFVPCDEHRGGILISIDGTSGPTVIPPYTPLPYYSQEAGDCPTNTSGFGTPASKLAAERATREYLLGRGIGVNRTKSCGLNQRFQGNECTDVSALDCRAFDYLDRLQDACNGAAITITAGSERGHLGHTRGNEVDLRQSDNFTDSLSQCIQSRFRYDAARGVYVDQCTGTTFLKERAGQFETTTGDHWHVEIGSGSCI